jgi:hypothetical protein
VDGGEEWVSNVPFTRLPRDAVVTVVGARACAGLSVRADMFEAAFVVQRSSQDECGGIPRVHNNLNRFLELPAARSNLIGVELETPHSNCLRTFFDFHSPRTRELCT